jgi:membrane-bound ClpP family serine protease
LNNPEWILRTLFVVMVVFAPVIVFIIIGLRMKKRPNQVGTESMAGKEGLVISVTDPEGFFRIEIRGESWKAVSESGRKYEKGDTVVIRKPHESELMLVVE